MEDEKFSEEFFKKHEGSTEEDLEEYKKINKGTLEDWDEMIKNLREEEKDTYTFGVQ